MDGSAADQPGDRLAGLLDLGLPFVTPGLRSVQDTVVEVLVEQAQGDGRLERLPPSAMAGPVPPLATLAG